MLANFIVIMIAIGATGCGILLLLVTIDFVMTRYYQGNPLWLVAFVVILVAAFVAFILNQNGISLV